MAAAIGVDVDVDLIVWVGVGLGGTYGCSHRCGCGSYCLGRCGVRRNLWLQP